MVRNVVIFAVLMSLWSEALVAAPAPELTPAERAAGWMVLDTDPSAWRGYRQDGVPANWTFQPNGGLATSGDGADLITREQFGDFELSLEWKSPEKGNSGIIYRVTEDFDATWMSGPEYQILDDASWDAAADDIGSSGALYGIVRPSAEKTLKPAGEWNHARIRLKDGKVQHWLNGAKMLECNIGDGVWAKNVLGSKFSNFKNFGRSERGHIALQSHGSAMEFRNIRVRHLDKPMPGEVALFNGKDFAGWTFIADGSPAESAWSVEDGVLMTDGEPVGFLRTNERFTNYVLKVEWRFNPVTKEPGNSGVLLRVLEDKVWPKSIEAQLLSEHAGDILTIGDFALSPDPSRTNGRFTAHSKMAERPVGEWNEYEIICDGEQLTIIVNGETVNVARGAEVAAGFIALQSEGAEIHFRNVRLAPIE